jgi:class 3 adenylate cyclase/tetratricopeptide (TPR) repeat protein
VGLLPDLVSADAARDFLERRLLLNETSVMTACPHCGATNAPDARFCSRCGSALAEPQPPREERKLVSVLFVDLVDSTARGDKADPEDVRDALAAFHREAKSCIEQYGGMVEKFIGDAVMAVFGAPIAHGDDAERAVRAGLRVLERIEVSARAAVNTGEAIVSVEHARTGGALATGDVVNTASRLQNVAPPGRVVVGADTYRATRQVIQYEELEPVIAKGKADALAVWLAVDASAEPAQRPLAATPLLGRDLELELLRSIWSRALDERRPHLVTLLGPPGIGKSRLCHEVAAFVAESDGRILRGRCLPYEEKSGYQAFSRVVHQASGILESDAPDAARAKLDSAVVELVPDEEASTTARYLALLLGLAPDDIAPQPGLLFYAARRFLECVGDVQPSVFVFEDIHWADASELALLHYLAQHVRDAPVLLVAAARPELLDLHPTWGAGLAAQTTIPLEPLAAAAAQKLAEHLAGGFDPARLVEVAGGNPLFLEELAASVAEAGSDEDLPVTVREAIAARLDAMPAPPRNLLLAAAVIGKTFWRGVVAAVGGDDGVDDALQVLEVRDLVRRDAASQLAGDVQYTFKHMLIREVAYATVPRATRRERHAAVARYIEDMLATDALSAILAYHWREAGEPARAVPHLLAAAEKARRSWAKEALLELYTRALELAEDDALRRHIRLQRGQALVELLDRPSAADELEALVPELEGTEKLEALIWLSIALVWSEREAAALATAGEAVELAERFGDESARASALAVRSHALAERGAEGDLDEAIELGDRALAQWPPGARTYEHANHLHLHADAKYWVGEYAQSVELSQQARRRATEVQSAEGLLRGGGFEALALAGLGRHEEALAIWEEMLKIAADLGHNPAAVLNYSALAYRELYDLDEARRRSEQALEWTEGMQFGMPRQFAGSDLVQTQLLAGDIGTARETWRERWADAEHATGWTTWLIAGRLALARAEIALVAETPESAAEWAQRGVDVARRTRRRKYEARSLSTFGQALVRLGRREDGMAALRAAIGIADDLVGAPARWGARAALGRVAYALGEDDAAAAAYTEARELLDAFSATLAPERAATLARAPVVSEIRSLVTA